MATVITDAVVSVDGFIADADDEVGPLFDWYFNGAWRSPAGSGRFRRPQPPASGRCGPASGRR